MSRDNRNSRNNKKPTPGIAKPTPRGPSRPSRPSRPLVADSLSEESRATAHRLTALGFDMDSYINREEAPDFDGTNGRETVYAEDLTEEQIMWTRRAPIKIDADVRSNPVYGLIAAAVTMAEEKAKANSLPPYTVPKFTVACFTDLVDEPPFGIALAAVLAHRGYYNLAPESPLDPSDQAEKEPEEEPEEEPEVVEEAHAVARAVANQLGIPEDELTAIPIDMETLEKIRSQRKGTGTRSRKGRKSDKSGVMYDGQNEEDTVYDEKMSPEAKAWVQEDPLPISEKDSFDAFRLVFVNIVISAREHADELNLPPAAVPKLAVNMMRGLADSEAAGAALAAALVELGYRNIPDLPQLDYEKGDRQPRWVE